MASRTPRPDEGDPEDTGRPDEREARGGRDPFGMTPWGDESSSSSASPSPGLEVVLWLILGFGLFYAFQTWEQSRRPEISYTEFKAAVEAGRVEAVTVEGRRVTGNWRPPAQEETAAQREDPAVDPGLTGGTGDSSATPEAGRETPAPGTERFRTQVPVFVEGELMELLETNDVTVRAREAGPEWWSRLLVGFLPWLLIFGLIYIGLRRMRSQMGDGTGLFSMGQSKAHRVRADEPTATFDDIAGAKSAKQDLREVVDYLREPEVYRRLGAKVPRGLLMVGPPGTGKTLLARAVAGEAAVPFFSISGSEFIEMFVGVGASRVRDLFRKAREAAPAIVFIDELDAIGRSRGSGLGGGHDEREQTLNQILSEMDGFSSHETVVVLAATNRPDVLDPALLRPGRFDRRTSLDLPQREAREAILKVHTRRIPLADDVDLETLARRTVGLSGADLENLANEAALFAGRDDADAVHMRHFDGARDRILLGAPREQKVDDAEREVIACHECGHALAALLFPKADPLEKLTIIPRGRALGATEQSPDEDRLNMTASYARDRIAVMLGGRVAEKLVFDEYSSGAESDIDQATRLARRMVSRWGMSEEIGPVSFSSSQEEVFLGKEIARERDFSEDTARRIDEQVQALIRDVEREVEQRLADARDELDAIVRSLLEHETLDAAEVNEILEETRSGAGGTRGEQSEADGNGHRAAG